MLSPNNNVSNSGLKILEAYTKDVGRGIARIDYDSMDSLKASTGDILEISTIEKSKNEKGKKTVAKCMPLYTSDEGKGVIRIDGIVRNNAGLAIGDIAQIRKIKVRPAEKVFVAPQQVIPPLDERYLSDTLESVSLSKGDNFIIPYFGGRLIFQVVDLTPLNSEAVIISQKTQFIITPPDQQKNIDIRNVTYEDIGGLRDETQRVREMIELPLRHPEIFEKLGIEAPKGVLLHGPPGTGKTLLAKAVANESNSNFISISGPEIMSKFFGESEARLREIFKEAREKAPSIIFMDEIDSIAPKREEVMGEVERRIVSQLLSVMDGLESRGKVVVIGASNRPNAIDPALRRPGRFDREIEIKVPNKYSRLDVLQVHTRNMPLNTNVDQDRIADITHGFVGADLEYLCKEAAMKCIRRLLPELKLEEEKVSSRTLGKLVIDMGDFLNAIKEITPSAMREVYLEPPNIKWDDIGGLDSVKRELREVVEWPIRFPQIYKKLGHTAPKGILIHGSSGTGKTMLAKAVATESEANFISVKGPELLSKWVGESERGIREIFRKARQASPCVIFFDEIDSIAASRGGTLAGGIGSGNSSIGSSYSGSERMLSQLLTEMDGIQEMHDIVVIAATNRVDMIDTALLRPGRFDRIIFTPNPDKATREKILQIHRKGAQIRKDVDLNRIAEITEGFSGADVSAVTNTAVSLVLKDHIQKYPSPEEALKHTSEALVSMRHFEDAIKKVRGQKEIKPEEKINLFHYR